MLAIIILLMLNATLYKFSSTRSRNNKKLKLMQLHWKWYYIFQLLRLDSWTTSKVKSMNQTDTILLAYCLIPTDPKFSAAIRTWSKNKNKSPFFYKLILFHIRLMNSITSSIYILQFHIISHYLVFLFYWEFSSSLTSFIFRWKCYAVRQDFPVLL